MWWNGKEITYRGQGCVSAKGSAVFRLTHCFNETWKKWTSSMRRKRREARRRKRKWWMDLQRLFLSFFLFLSLHWHFVLSRRADAFRYADNSMKSPMKKTLRAAPRFGTQQPNSSFLFSFFFWKVHLSSVNRTRPELISLLASFPNRKPSLKTANKKKKQNRNSLLFFYPPREYLYKNQS